MRDRRIIATIFEDASILVVSKPSGTLVLPERWEEGSRTIVDELGDERADLAASGLFVVHRLDRDTSGVLVLAKSAEAHRALSLAFEERRATKVYHALVAGEPDWEEKEVDLPLIPDGDREHRTVVGAAGGKPSRTALRVLARYRRITLVEARPETGRTHQIRVHLAAIGHPALCDPIYGDGRPLYLSGTKKGWKGDQFDERPLLSRTALHALSLEVAHPLDGAPLRFEAPYPRDLAAALTQLGKIGPSGRRIRPQGSARPRPKGEE